MMDAIRVEELDLGDLPLRLAGLKVYDTKDDEVIIEAPIQWGSAIKVLHRCQLKSDCACLVHMCVTFMPAAGEAALTAWLDESAKLQMRAHTKSCIGRLADISPSR